MASVGADAGGPRGRGTRRCWCRPCRTTPHRGTRTLPRPTPRRARRRPVPTKQRGRSPHRVVERDETTGRRHHQDLVRQRREPGEVRGQTGCSAASATVVTSRSYSRNSGETSCEHTTSRPVAASACATARSWADSGRRATGRPRSHRRRRSREPSRRTLRPQRPTRRVGRSPRTARVRRRGPAVGRRAGRRATAAPGARSRYVGEPAGGRPRATRPSLRSSSRWSPPSSRAPAARAGARRPARSRRRRRARDRRESTAP